MFRMPTLNTGINATFCPLLPFYSFADELPFPDTEVMLTCCEPANLPSNLEKMYPCHVWCLLF